MKSRPNQLRHFRSGSLQEFFAYEKLEPRNLLAGDLTSTVALATSGPSSLIFTLEEPVPVEQRMDLLREHLGLESNEQLRLIDIKRDLYGFAHVKYQQYLNGYEVVGGVYSAHVKDRQIVTLSGDFKNVGELESTAVIAELTAFQNAIESVDASVYVWNDPGFIGLNGEPNQTVDSAGQSDIPEGELVFLQTASGEFQLTYKFDILAIDPFSRANIFVDASTGEVVASHNLIYAMDTPATGTSLYNGTVSFTAFDLGNEFILLNLDPGVQTLNLNSSTNVGDAVDFSSPTPQFVDPQVHTGVQAHYGAEQTLDLLRGTYGYDSYDGLGSVMSSFTSYGNNVFNAFWMGDFAVFGDGDGMTSGPLVSLDIVGHEFFHGVTQYSANLVYADEPGALNESFSDIFGKTVENHATGQNNWRVGHDIGLFGSGAIRNMEDPNEFSDPDTYLGDFWSGSGAVHTNSGVQNKWFQLLTDGGVGTNDNGDDYDVAGIAIDDAAAIAFRNLTVYLTPDSQYADARIGAIRSAVDLFGGGSQQHLSTADAWDAVGVYDPRSTFGLQGPLAIHPDGSLIYQNEITAVIDGETHVYPLELDANQTLTFSLQTDSSLEAVAELKDISGNVIATADARNGIGLVQSIAIPTIAFYEIEIDGGGTTGEYSLEIWLNTLLEEEGLVPDSFNGSIESAQNIELSSIPLGGFADRLGVVGTVGGSEDTRPVIIEGFETGRLDGSWTIASSDAGGRIQITDEWGTASGSYAMIMDQADGGVYNLNEAIWTVDVTDLIDPSLSFYYSEFNDETNPLPNVFAGSFDGDGVSISEDGENWYTILTETDTEAGIWVQAQFGLVEIAAQTGLALDGEFHVKFQQYDNFGADTDGRGYDQISVGVPAGTTSVISEGFETGMLDASWTTSSSDSGGRIQVTDIWGTASGAYAMIMDQANEGVYNLNEAIWTVNVSSLVSPSLSFFFSDFNDEQDSLPDEFIGSFNGDGVAISEDGVNWHTILTDTDTETGVWIHAQFALAEIATQTGLALDGEFQIKFQQYDDFAADTDGLGYDQISIQVPDSGEDWYSFRVADQQLTTVVATAQDIGEIRVDVFDADGNQLKSGTIGSNVSSFANQIVGTGGIYYARVMGVSEYSLVVTRGADFDLGPNDTFGAEAQEISGVAGVLGYVATLDAMIAEPDTGTIGQVLNNVFPGVTLSNSVTGGDVFAADASRYGAPTGTLVFSPSPLTANGWRDGLNILRADFDDLQSFVSIDVGADDDFDTGYVRAYAADGTFLHEVISNPLAEGESETLTITRPTAEIAYILASGVGGDITPFDNLVYQLSEFDEDIYSIEVSAGDNIGLTGIIPGGGPFTFENDLSNNGNIALRMELIDPQGNVIAVDAETIDVVAASSGTYQIRVYAEPGASGEYFLLRDIVPAIADISGVDFGPDGSDIFEDYAGVSNNGYNPDSGYGWRQLEGYSSIGGNRGNDLVKDRVILVDGTFVINVENGNYNVDVRFGAVSNKTDEVTITVEGQVDTFRPQAGPNVVRSYVAEVTDGELTFEFSGAPGLDRFIRLAGIEFSAQSSRTFKGTEWSDAIAGASETVLGSRLEPTQPVQVPMAFPSVIRPEIPFFKSPGLTGSHELTYVDLDFQEVGRQVLQVVESTASIEALNDVLEDELAR